MHKIDDLVLTAQQCRTAKRQRFVDPNDCRCDPKKIFRYATVSDYMEAFEPISPSWTQSALHAREFCCPRCNLSSLEAEKVWINRRSPVFTEDHRRKWQEFYSCPCGTVWWAWSSDRPANDLLKPNNTDTVPDDYDLSDF